MLRVILVKISHYFYLYRINRLLLGAFAKLPKGIISFVISVRPDGVTLLPPEVFS
jgi:hypothetical protein